MSGGRFALALNLLKSGRSSIAPRSEEYEGTTFREAGDLGLEEGSLTVRWAGLNLVHCKDKRGKIKEEGKRRKEKGRWRAKMQARVAFFERGI